MASSGFNIGLDFGTTTSILSYHNGQYLDVFKHGGASGTPYIPSVLSQEKDSGHFDIGTAARLHLGDNDYQVYTRFKMLLAENDEHFLAEQGFAQRSPQQVAQEYIGRLLDSYRQEMKLAELPQKVVITVPEIWVREGRHAAREALKNICRNLNLSGYKMLSEPQAATVYFADRYKNKHGKAFNGHVLVCDYGGGTLDLSLSKVAGETVTILEGTGKGHSRVGAAGVAFDEAVVARVMSAATLTAKQHYRILKEFEDHKIGLVDKISKQLAQYRKNLLLNKKLFEIGDTPVTPEDLTIVFDEHIAPSLHNALQEMGTCLQQHQVDSTDGEAFRVVMVGGFSNFYPVQHAVKTFFDSTTSADSRFDSCFELIDTALAIAKGAALVANNQFEVQQVCPISVGIQVKDAYLQNMDVVCLEKGQSLKTYATPNYFNGWLEVLSDEALDTRSLTIFLDITGGKRRYLDLQGNLRALLPYPHQDNKWQIGFSVDDDLIFTLHIKDVQNHTADVDLGDLQEKINGLHISEKSP